MCGIVGGVDENLNLDEFSKSVELLTHRSLDANGTWHSDSCFHGHTRPSIFDLNERSNQPFTDGVDDSVLVYNGEIYNFKEICIILLSFSHSKVSALSIFNVLKITTKL